MANSIGGPPRAEGLLFAGILIGTDKCITSHADAMSDDVAKFINVLQDTPFPLQDVVHAPQSFNSDAQLVYLPCGVPWLLVGDAIQHVQSALSEATLIHRSRLSVDIVPT